MIDERTGEAVGVFAESARECFRVVVDGAVATQRQSLNLLWGWMGDPAGSFDRTSRIVEEQVEINQRTARALAEQFERQQEAAQVLALESSRIYMGRSPAFPVFPTLPILRDRGASGGEEDQGRNLKLPIEDFDRLDAEEIAGRLGDLDGSEIERLRLHEKQHKNRRPVLERLNLGLV